ncbi:MAG: gliding motility protein GldL [Bacteroidales bacterium]|nr:gliding motility protein GldL [Bacteroidales bacterium]
MDSKKNSSLNTAMAQQIPDERSHTATSVAETHPTASDHSPLSTAPHSHSTTAPIDPGYEILPNLSTHSEEYGKQMENLNRTLSGLNSIYEIQLKSVSSQIGTIEQINQGLARLRNIYDDRLPDGSVIKTETEKMADQLRELNEVYARMLNAMTVIKPDNRNNSNS